MPCLLIPLQAQEAINWQEWNKEIDPKLVQQFKQAYESASGCLAAWLPGRSSSALQSGNSQLPLGGWVAHMLTSGPSFTPPRPALQP